MSQESNALPEEFLSRLRSILAEHDYCATLRTFAGTRVVGFRVNRLRAPLEETLDELTALGIEGAPLSWCETGFTVPTDLRQTLVDAPATRDGRVYIQNTASLLPVCELNPQPGETVLDLAAAPGGKTLHIADLMQMHGVISAVEVVRNRFYRLKENLRVGGAGQVRTYLTDGRTVGRKTPDRFDRVLLDAPCSSEARFQCSDPKSYQFWSVRKIREQARKQVGLLLAAIAATRPGGEIVYCTCSFSPEENELTVDKALAQTEHSVELVPFELSLPNFRPGLTHWEGKDLDPGLSQAVRVLPTEAMHAFFMARIKKLGSRKSRA